MVPRDGGAGVRRGRRVVHAAVGAFTPRIAPPGELVRVQGMRGLSLILLFAVRVRESGEPATRRHGLREGLRYIRAHRTLFPLITVVGLSEMCFSGPVGPVWCSCSPFVPLVQIVVHPDYLGRVTSVTTLFTLGLAPALFPAVGFVVDRWGSAAFFAGCGGVCLLAAAVALLARPVRRASLG